MQTFANTAVPRLVTEDHAKQSGERLSPALQIVANPPATKEFNWQADQQQTFYPDAFAMKRHAELAAPAFAEIAQQLRNEIDPQISIDIENLVKSPESIARKLHDSSIHGNISNIGDPVRLGLTIPDGPNSVATLSRLIQSIKSHPNCTSWKDEYAYPNNETHYSSFKAHISIEAPDGRFITGEFQVHHESMLKANQITKRLSDSVRCIESKIRDTANIFLIDDSTLRRQLTSLSTTRDYFDKVKRIIHDSARSSAGLDVMLASEMRSICGFDDPRSLPAPTKGARSMLHYLLPDNFQKILFNRRSVSCEQVSNFLFK